MATPTSATVGPGGGPTYDYASLNAAEAGESKDFVSADEQLTITCTSFGATGDTVEPVWNGSTTDATRYIRVVPESGDEAVMPWSNDMYFIKRNGAIGMRILDGYMRIENIGIWNEYTSGAAECIRLATGHVGSRLIGLYLRGPNDATYANYGVRGSAAGASYVWNTVVRQIGTNSGSYGINCGAFAIETYNCTIYDVYTGVSGSSSIPTVKNVLVQNTTTGFAGSYTGASDYNAADDTTAPGSNSVDNPTVTFEDASGGDFHLVSTDTDVIDAGVSDPSSGLFSDDFDRVTRSGTWDIGADEYVAAAGGNPWHAYAQQ